MSAAIMPLEERVSASSPEGGDPAQRSALPSTGDGERQWGQDAATHDLALEELPPAWGEQTSSSPYRLKAQWRRAEAGKGLRYGGGQRTARSTLLPLRIHATGQHPPGAGKLRAPVVQSEPRLAVETLNNALTRELEQSQWLTLQRAADPLLMSAALAERPEPKSVRGRQKQQTPQMREPQILSAPVRQERAVVGTQWIYRFRGQEGEFVQIQAADDAGAYRLIPSSHQMRERLTAHLHGAPSGVCLMNVPAVPPPLPEAPT
ncbi:hypothetical protein [Sodalis glossinidius]|uniref:hypothetical protein n=1 Tax=Sodalis glossinidius TaxID=63612 RepID=UPI00141319E2|nr:hypothetical protein [Sodalis glossinidius]